MRKGSVVFEEDWIRWVMKTNIISILFDHGQWCFYEAH